MIITLCQGLCQKHKEPGANGAEELEELLEEEETELQSTHTIKKKKKKNRTRSSNLNYLTLWWIVDVPLFLICSFHF